MHIACHAYSRHYLFWFCIYGEAWSRKRFDYLPQVKQCVEDKFRAFFFDSRDVANGANILIKERCEKWYVDNVIISFIASSSPLDGSMDLNGSHNNGSLLERRWTTQTTRPQPTHTFHSSISWLLHDDKVRTRGQAPLAFAWWNILLVLALATNQYLCFSLLEQLRTETGKMFRFIYAFWFLSWNRLRHGSVAAAECEWCMAIEKPKRLLNHIKRWNRWIMAVLTTLHIHTHTPLIKYFSHFTTVFYVLPRNAIFLAHSLHTYFSFVR